MLQLFLLMVGGHFLADYPLQGDFLAKAKNRFAPLPGVPWWQALFAHAYIQALFVFVFTHSLVLAGAELAAHCFIDDTKCAGRIGYNTDQALHVACKLVWAAIAAGVLRYAH